MHGRGGCVPDFPAHDPIDPRMGPRGRVRAVRCRPFVVGGELHMSGRKFSFEVNRTVNAPAATLFRLESDGANWSSWAKPLVLQSSWARQGDSAPGGVGAVRKVGLWPFLVQEETVEYEQDHRHVYKLVGPPTPAKDYLAEVVLTPNAAGGTDLRWSGSFTEGVRGHRPGDARRVGRSGPIVCGSSRQDRRTGVSRLTVGLMRRGFRGSPTLFR